MSIVANVTDGKVEISHSSQDTERKTGSSLDKDDFLLLLVTQMKYQDPLEPSSNTEYVAQLAQFSSLEQMQNLNQTTTNTSAYSLVGKEVYIESTSSTGATTSVQGPVEYVTIQNSKAYVSVNGELYPYEDVVQVIDELYLISQYLPSVSSQSHTFLHHDAQDVVISGIELGSNGYEASNLAVVLIDSDGTKTQIPAEKMSYKNGKLTISKDAFESVMAGEYILAFVFDDVNTTVDYTSVKLTVKGNVTVVNDETTDTGSGNETDSETDTGTVTDTETEGTDSTE